MITEKDLELLHKRIDGLSRELQRIKANSAPTLPIYDSTNFPQDAVEGQIAIDTASAGWVYGSDDAWHKLGGGLSVVGVNTWNSFGSPTTIADGSSSALIPATNASGPTYFTTGVFNCTLTAAGLYSVAVTLVNKTDGVGAYTPGGWWDASLSIPSQSWSDLKSVVMPNVAATGENSQTSLLSPIFDMAASSTFTISANNNDGGGHSLGIEIQNMLVIKYA